eukprot:64752-Chlamydomonas_euryale.AAC.3
MVRLEVQIEVSGSTDVRRDSRISAHRRGASRLYITRGVAALPVVMGVSVVQFNCTFQGCCCPVCCVGLEVVLLRPPEAGYCHGEGCCTA